MVGGQEKKYWPYVKTLGEIVVVLLLKYTCYITGEVTEALTSGLG